LLTIFYNIKYIVTGMFLKVLLIQRNKTTFEK